MRTVLLTIDSQREGEVQGYIREVTTSGFCMIIPKIIHHIWIGDELPSAEAVENINTWKQHHPDWIFRLWTTDNLPKIENQRLYDSNSNTGHRTDILRYEILYQFGGVYADADMICHRNIEPLLGHLGGFVAAHGQHGAKTDWWPEIAFMGAVPYHPLLKRVLDNLQSHYNACEHESTAIKTGPGYFGTCLSHWRTESWRMIDEDFAIFPPHYFMPYSFADKMQGRRGFYPNAYAEHLWWGSWVATAESQDTHL